MNRLAASGFSVFAELQRPHVYKVGGACAVAGWLLAQVMTRALPVFDLPMAQSRPMLVLLAGFSIAPVLAWLFDVTPDVVVRTEPLPSPGETPQLRKDCTWNALRGNPAFEAPIAGPDSKPKPGSWP